MQSAPSTVWTSMRRRRTIDHAIATGASPTRSALRSATKPFGSGPLVGAAAAMTSATTVTSAARRTRPRGTWAAESAAMRVAPCNSTATTPVHAPVRPRGHERECRNEQQEDQTEAVLGALTEAGTAHEPIVVRARRCYPDSAGGGY